MKKFICLLLILAMVAIPFVACANKDTGKTPADTAGNNPGNNTSDANDVLEIPEGYKFDEPEFNIMYEQAQEYGYFPMDFEDPPSDDFYAIAIHKRNLAVEEKLDIEIVGKMYTSAGDLNTAFSTDVTGDNNFFDACFNNVSYMMGRVTSKQVISFDYLPYVKLDKSWWNTDCKEQLSIAGKSYLNSGDIMISDKEVIWAMYFIKHRIEDKGLESPYNLVKDGRWTWDEMYKMAWAVHDDADGNDKMTTTGDDVFGLCTHHENYAASWESAGLRAITPDSNGVPTHTWGTEKFQQIWNEADELITDSMVVSGNNIAFISEAIKKDKTLFGTEVIAFVRSYRDSDSEFGILPYPKYDSSIERYNSYVAINSCVVGVGYTNPRTESISIVLETMAAYGKEFIIPTYYEEQLKLRYSIDEESSSMLDIIFAYRCYDLGVFIDSKISGIADLNGNTAVEGTNVARLWTKSKTKVTGQLEDMLDKLLND